METYKIYSFGEDTTMETKKNYSIGEDTLTDTHTHQYGGGHSYGKSQTIQP